MCISTRGTDISCEDLACEPLPLARAFPARFRSYERIAPPQSSAIQGTSPVREYNTAARFRSADRWGTAARH